MEVTNSFIIPVQPEEGWPILLDFPLVAQCMPGAELTSVDEARLSGTVTVKLGPMRLKYVGEALITERDDEARRLRMEAKGREERGSGTAKVAILASLHPHPEGTQVEMVSSIDVTGRPAQMGAGLIGDVAQRITDQFAKCLGAKLADAKDAGPVDYSEDITAKGTNHGKDTLNLGSVAALPLARRLLSVIAVVLIGLVVWWLIRAARS